MLLIILVFLSGFLLSAVAAYYSIVGLIAIFPGAAFAVAAMGTTLEVGKLVASSWLYRNWNTAPRFIKWYLSIAVLVIMFITSMGIFGFLSKAHIEQASPKENVYAQIELIDEKINLRLENIEAEKKNIEVARSSINQLDAQVNARMGMLSSTDAERGIQVRRQQKAERDSLALEIQQAQDKISKYNEEVSALREEKMPLQTGVREIELEVGPLKYIAELIYDGDAKNYLDKAVRWVIIILVLVFDPFAVALLLAGNINLVQIQKRKQLDFSREEEYDKPDVNVNTYSFMMGEDFNIKHVDGNDAKKSKVEKFRSRFLRKK